MRDPQCAATGVDPRTAEGVSSGRQSNAAYYQKLPFCTCSRRGRTSCLNREERIMSPFLFKQMD